MNKQELIEALEEGREDFLELLEDISDEEMLESGVAGEWSIKDILSHLSRWEAELVKLLWQAINGQEPASELTASLQAGAALFDDVNRRWWEADKERPLPQILSDFDAVRSQTIRRVQAFSNKDLTDPQRYLWLEGRPLWEWIEGDSYGHEAEHAGQIRSWLETRRRS
jgi:hypothetical protein